jgi:hypothetical protein
MKHGTSHATSQVLLPRSQLRATMFSTLGLFSKTRCPDRINCKRPHCVFSHQADLPPEPTLKIPVHVPQAAASSLSLIPAKRPAAALVSNASIGEPSSKLQKTGIATKRSIAAVSTPKSSVSRECIAPGKIFILFAVRRTHPQNHPISLYSRDLCSPGKIYSI